MYELELVYAVDLIMLDVRRSLLGYNAVQCIYGRFPNFFSEHGCLAVLQMHFCVIGNYLMLHRGNVTPAEDRIHAMKFPN